MFCINYITISSVKNTAHNNAFATIIIIEWGKPILSQITWHVLFKRDKQTHLSIKELVDLRCIDIQMLVG